jgi:hypothetical protein
VADDAIGGLHGALDDEAPIHHSADEDEPAEILEDETDESAAPSGATPVLRPAFGYRLRVRATASSQPS